MGGIAGSQQVRPMKVGPRVPLPPSLSQAVISGPDPTGRGEMPPIRNSSGPLAMAELFVEGQPPDFSVLQELLCPPCLESEPGSSSNCSSSSSSSSSSHLPEAASSRPSRFDPFDFGMACCLQIPESKALGFLHETAQLLSRPEASYNNYSSSSSSCPNSSSSEYPPWRSSNSNCCLAEATLASLVGPLDALSLLSLHCSSPLHAGEEPQEERPRAAIGGPPRHPEPPRGGPRRVPRKQPSPRRSCDALDPAFQGVTFQMRLRLCPGGSEEGCGLLICPRYSSGKRRKRRAPLAKEEVRAGSSEEEEGCLPTHRNKRCASCKTRRTPLWRDAEDGTPLCNACGIRYKKYRIRCFQCWNIPKHGGKPYSHCFNCGGRLRVVATQPKSGKRYATF